MLFRRRPKTVWELRLRGGIGWHGETRWQSMLFESEALAMKWLLECEPERGELDYILYRIAVRTPHNYLFRDQIEGHKAWRENHRNLVSMADG